MRVSVLGLAVVLSVAACKGKAKRVEEPAPAADPNPATEADPAAATTPEKVQREVEQIGEQHEKQIDETLDVQ
jgi:hypothetical protein